MEDKLQLNIDLSSNMHSQNYYPSTASTPIMGTTLDNLYQGSNSMPNPVSNVRFNTGFNMGSRANSTGGSRNIKIHNCHVRDVGLENKAPASVEWTRVSGTITSNFPTKVNVKEGYQFRTFTEGGSSQPVDVNNVQENNTVYVWADGNVSMIGCQPQCININNCYNMTLNLQMSTDGRNWQDFMVDGQQVVVYSQTHITVDIPGGVFLRLIDTNIISGIYRVPVDPSGLERFPDQVFFRTNGTVSTSTCQNDMSEVVAHNCYSVPVSIEVKDNAVFRTIAELDANSFSETLQIKEGSQVRLVNRSMNIISGIFTVTKRGETVIYFRTDGTINHTTCRADISVNVFNCGAVDLQVQVRGTEGDDWVTVSSVVVAGSSTTLRFRAGSQIRLVSADESFTTQVFNVPQKQSDVPNAIHFRRDGQISVVGCEVPPSIPPTGIPPAGIPPTIIPPAGIPPTGIPPAGIPPTIIPPGARLGNGLITLLTVNNCYSMTMILQNRKNGQWQNFTPNGQEVTIPAGNFVVVPVPGNITLRLISMNGSTISGVIILTGTISAQIFFRSDGHVSTNSCKLPCSHISNCYDFHMTLQEQLINGTWQDVTPEIKLCAKESVDIVLTVGKTIRLFNCDKDIASGDFKVPSDENGSTIFFRSDGTVSTTNCDEPIPETFFQRWGGLIIFIILIIIVIFIFMHICTRGGEQEPEPSGYGAADGAAPPMYTNMANIPVALQDAIPQAEHLVQSVFPQVVPGSTGGGPVVGTGGVVGGGVGQPNLYNLP